MIGYSSSHSWFLTFVMVVLEPLQECERSIAKYLELSLNRLGFF
jgi:transcription termination factor NusB